MTLQAHLVGPVMRMLTIEMYKVKAIHWTPKAFRGSMEAGIL